MKIQHRFSLEADAAASRYDLLVGALRGLYLDALGSRDFGAPSLLNAVRRQGRGMVDTYLRAERTTAETTLAQIASEAHRSTKRALAVYAQDEMSDAALELLSAMADYMLQEIALQAARDVATVVEEVRRASLQSDLAQRASGAIVPVDSRGVELSFHFRDRRNHRIQSRIFVRGVWRQSLLTVYNETVLLTLADHRADHAEIDHLDGKAPPHGARVAMVPGGDHPTYDEIRADVFHPNSDAVLKPLGA